MSDVFSLPPAVSDPERIVTAPELCEILQISERKLRDMISQRIIRPLDLGGRALRFHLRTVLKQLGAAA